MNHKHIKVINFIVLGIATFTGLAGNADLAIAGIAIYLTSKELP